MQYDLLVYDSENLADAFNVGSNLIRINGLSSVEVEAITEILVRHGASVCLLPNGGE